MNVLQIIYPTIITFLIFMLIVKLIRRGTLRINYSILWLLSSIILFLFAVFFIIKYDWVNYLAKLFYINEPKNFYYIFLLSFLLAIAFQFSIIISHLVLKVKNLSQKIALLEEETRNQINSQENKIREPQK